MTSNPSVVCVGGTSRSGSTLLHLMLGSSPYSFSVGEIESWFRPTDRHHHTLECACGDEYCSVWSELRELRPSQFHKSAALKRGVDYIIDSSKSLSWLIDVGRWSYRNTMHVRYVFVWKEPIDLAFSFWKRGHEIGHWRREFVKYYRRMLEVPFPMRTVRFRDLTADTQGVLQAICQFTDIPFSSDMIEFWKQDHHHLFGSFGVRRQVEQKDSRVVRSFTYPAEFQPHVQPLLDSLAEDHEVNDLIGNLKLMDIYGAAAFGQKDSPFLWKPPIPYPTWYFGQRGKRILKRFIPDASDLARSRSVATVPKGDQSSH